MLPAILTPIPMPFAQNGERRAIPETNTVPGSADASWATGFPPVTRINKQAGGKPPYGMDFQGIFHTICEHLFFSQSGNTVPWVGASDGQPGLNYFKGAIVQGSDGGTYMALKPSGPDTPNPAGGGMVGPVDPVGDESGHWINLNLLYGGMPNSEQWITASDTWIAPVAGWYDVFAIDGGNGGAVYPINMSVQGGRSGAYKRALAYFSAGQSVQITIGAGGLANTQATSEESILGGITSVGDIDFSRYEFCFLYGDFNYFSQTMRAIAEGGGFGGPGLYYNSPGWYGSGGAAYAGQNGQSPSATDGISGAVCFRWHDPAKAAGPLPTPVLFSARRMTASRAAAAPATVNLYDPETGLGSVWREEDAEAQLAKGMITEEAWLEICAAKAAEEYAAWLVDPETEAERFEMLRAARDVKLAATDYLVAPDYPLTEEQRAAVTAYRQALRDLPAQEGAPWDGGGEATPWPEMPAVSKVQE